MATTAGDLAPPNPFFNGPDRIREAVWSFGGPAHRQFVWRWPADLTADELGEVEELAALLLRGMRREVGERTKPTGATHAG